MTITPKTGLELVDGDGVCGGLFERGLPNDFMDLGLTTNSQLYELASALSASLLYTVRQVWLVKKNGVQPRHGLPFQRGKGWQT